ncbi:FAS1-like dehydratase domain-containing protein [Sphingobium subterraneum]|uniref:3-methylfumaryl-CoA hydratase n=1 Tax=Sphingobium subterraneum TaxID=627688 RepID=A0A841IYF6_9SPHN|nr:MaoC family dehydratase N-terminal domain-containing protein [Sphingobium subterraneum]MBB6123350.1 3-methylfumaryl-CoA hydratase [Sphingobium subterraneum]
MTSKVAIDLDFLRSWIGREQTLEDVVTLDLARKFHATLELPGPPPERGQPAAPLIHFCLAQPAVPTAELAEDGHPAKGGFLPPVPLPRRMWAGGDVTFHGPIVIGEAVRRVSRVVDLRSKSGRSGHLVFVTVEHRLESGSRLLVQERQDIVYRDAVTGETAPQPVADPAGVGQEHQDVAISPPLLFRYSALTFNSHRIHYDRDYAVGVEGYRDLVVHGPLQATLLCNLAARIKGKPATHFSFRAQSPVFADDILTLNASADGAEWRLWTCRPDGPVAMSATARWADDAE